MLGLFMLLAIGATSLHAQRFQETFGTPDPLGEEANAVIQTFSGDYVAAGVTHGNTIPQIGVVSTDANGSPIWTRSYTTNFFKIHGAYDIKEFPSGGFVVVGWGVETPGVSDTMGLVMRIDNNGFPVWIRSFWINNGPAVPRSVVVTQLGNGGTTNPEDIVIAGSTRPWTSNPPIPGTHDAVLARLDGNGNMIWCRSYDHPNGPSSPDEILYGVDESLIVSSGGTLGDIVATGVIYDIPAGNPEEVLVMRVDGNDGKFNAFPQSSSSIGDVNSEIGYSIQELRNGSFPGELVITGASNSRPFPSTAKEAFLLQMPDDPCVTTPPTVTYIGDDAGNDEWGTCVREITSPNVGSVGNIVVGGLTYASAFGGIDGFMQEFQEGSLAPVSAYYYYGDFGDDEIRSIAEIPNAPGSSGYIYGGVTNSQQLITPGHTRNLWLGKTDNTLDNVCYATPSGVSYTSPFWFTNCLPSTNRDDVIVAYYEAYDDPVSWNFYQPCFSPFKTVMPDNGSAPGSDAGGTAAILLSSYPNPVRGEGHITLAYSLLSSGVVDIIITDPLGDVRYERSTERAAGDGTEQITIQGWSAGTYLARITANGISATTKIVLIGY